MTDSYTTNFSDYDELMLAMGNPVNPPGPFNDYIDRVKQGFNVLGRIPKNLAIEYIEDGESVGKERLIISNS